MKLITATATALLAVNVVLIGTFTYSAVTKTPDVQPWAAISQVLSEEKPECYGPAGCATNQ